jgi:hypothetical protein
MSLAEVGERRAGKPTGSSGEQLADEVQRVALSEVPYVPWGEWVQPTAFRNNIKDILKFEAPIFWGI